MEIQRWAREADVEAGMATRRSAALPDADTFGALPDTSAARSLRIAMIGQKGVPATFGGIEHHVQEIGARLAGRGHQVTIFCRRNYSPEERAEFMGMRLRHLPTVGTKHLDAITHSAAATIAAMREREPYDVIHYHGEGPGMLAFAPRLASSAKVVLTIHGLDHERAKWSRMARAVLKAAGWLSGRVPDATITVSRDLTEFYARHYGCPAVHIPNGVTDRIVSASGPLPFGLKAGRYVAFVGRLVPEKRPDVLIRAFSSIPGDLRLVIAGGASFTTSYVDHLRRLAAHDERVMFTGYVFGEELRSLYGKAAAFVLPSSLEGMPLTLLEAIASGTPVVVSDIPPHVEVVGHDAPGHHIFPTDDVDALRRSLIAAVADPAAERAGVSALRRRVLNEYSWDAAAKATERLYYRLVHGGPARLRSVWARTQPATAGLPRPTRAGGSEQGHDSYV
jgi:glycosyltransferase involved in cell wall biosynthesis